MAVPKRKISKQRKRKRRTHYKDVRVIAGRCNCGEARLPHHACPKCGSYKGKQELDVIKEEVEE